MLQPLPTKRGAHAMGNGMRNKTLSGAELGATAFGMPRWEPPSGPAAAREAQIMKSIRAKGLLANGAAPDPLRRYRSMDGQPTVLPHWMVAARAG